MKKRQNYSNEFKFNVSIELLKEKKTLAQLSQEYEIHPNVLRNWMNVLIAHKGEVYNKKTKTHQDRQNFEKERDRLHKTIGQLTVERDFLKKKYKQIYGKEPDM